MKLLNGQMKLQSVKMTLTIFTVTTSLYWSCITTRTSHAGQSGLKHNQIKPNQWN